MKGMQKIKRGTGFRGALDYALDRDGEKSGQIVGGNMSGETAKELSAEFKVSRGMRPDISKPVWHNALRLPEGERISEEKWQQIADDYMNRMGFSDEHQRTYIMHDDPEGQHLHIIASRISLDGSLYYGKNENLKSTKCIAELEQVHGLTISPGINQDSGKQRRLSKGEIEMSIKNGEAAPKLVLQQAIDEALKDNPDTAAFIERLEAAGITPRPNIASTGRMNGFSFECDGVAFKASSLGKSYSWSQLQKRGLDYDQERDTDVLRAAKERSEKPAATLEQGPDTGSAPAPEREYKRTLDLLFDERGEQFRWKNGRLAFEDKGDVIQAHSVNAKAVKAIVQLALEKSWSELVTTTDDQRYANEIYRQARLAGYPASAIKFKELEPEQSVIDEVEKGLNDEQNRASQSVSNTAQQSDLSADQRAAASAEPQRREPGTADRAFSAEPRSTERRGQGSDHAASQDSSSAAAADERESQRSGRQMGRSSEDTGASADTAARSSRRLMPGFERDRETEQGRVDEGLAGSYQQQRADSAGAGERIRDLAAASFERRKNGSQGLSQPGADKQTAVAGNRQEPVAAHIKAKQHAWRQQHEALQAPAYRITLTARREELKTYNMGKGKAEDGQEKFYTAQEVAELIPQLSRQNARGYDIYVTPISDQQHYIVLDDSDQARLEQMHERTGITPALIQESSPGNLQAIIKADKVQGHHEQSSANHIVQGLNKQYGDPKFTGVVHPFRMSGFMNQKEQYEQNGRRPIVRPRPVITLSTKSDSSTNDMLKKQREQQQEQEQRQRERREQEHKQARHERIEHFQKPSGSRIDAEQRYLIEAHKCVDFVKKQGWPVDYSKIDFYVCKQMLKDDYFSESQIEDALKKCSPNLVERHKNVDDYAARTIENAARDPEVVQHLEQESEYEMRGPSL